MSGLGMMCGQWKACPKVNLCGLTGVSVNFLMLGETDYMVGYHLMTDGSNFLKNVLNLGLKKMFEKLKIDAF